MQHSSIKGVGESVLIQAATYGLIRPNPQTIDR